MSEQNFTPLAVEEHHGPGGRPSKYQSDFPQRVLSYLERCNKEKRIPYIEQVELELDIDDDTIVDWSDPNSPRYKPDFSASIKRLKLTQRMYLQGLGLGKQGAATMSIFLLKANHGFMETEKREIKQEGSLTIHSSLEDGELNTLIASKVAKVRAIAAVGGERAANESQPAQILDATHEADGSDSQ